jgi:catecholate siderophore receptor
MKRHRNRSIGKRRLFEAVVRGWTVRKHSRRAVVGMLGAAALLGGWTRQARAQDAYSPTPAVIPSETPVDATQPAPASAPVEQNTVAPAYMPEVLVTGEKGRKPASPKFTQPLRDTPQTINVIPKQAIQEQGATTMRDVLRNVPGISIQAGEGGVPAGDNLSIRGFNARTDFFVDGVRDFGGYSRDPFNVEQVEVFKGPASTYAGRGSTGGSINTVTKKPFETRSYAGSVMAGSAETFRGTLDLNQPITAGIGLRVNAMTTEGNIPGRDVVDNERWGVAPSLTFGMNGSTKLTLGYFHLEQDNLPDYGIPWVPNTNTALAGYQDQPPPVDFSTFYGIKTRDFEDIDTHIGTAELSHDFNESVSLRNQLRLGRTVRDSVITAPRFAANNATTINRNLQSRDQADGILSNQTDVSFKFNTGSVGHALVTGMEWSRETSVNHARTAAAAPAAPLYSPNPDDAFTGVLVRTGARTDATAKSLSGYLFDTLTLTERWELLGGLRLDSFDVDFVSVSTGGAPSSLSRKDNMLSWRTGVVFKPVRPGSFYLALGTSFNPSAEGLTLANTATAANSINVKPEENRSVELGTKWDFLREQLSFSAAVFRTEKTNARTEDPANPSDVIVLEGEQRVEGFEAGAAGKLTDKWSLSGGYTYLDGKVVASRNLVELGRTLTNTPRHSLSAWTSYQLPWNIDVGGGLQYVGERVNSTTTPRKAPGYWVADAMLAYRINENIGFRLNGYNLADENYIDRVGGGHFIPGAGRSGTLTTDFKF